MSSVKFFIVLFNIINLDNLLLFDIMIVFVFLSNHKEKIICELNSLYFFILALAYNRVSNPIGTKIICFLIYKNLFFYFTCKNSSYNSFNPVYIF